MSRTSDRKIEDKLLDGRSKRLRKETLAGSAKAVGSLQTIQAAEHDNKNSSASGASVKKNLGNSYYGRKNPLARQIGYEYHGNNVLNGGHILDELKRMSCFNLTIIYHIIT